MSKARVRRAFDRAAGTYDSAAGIQRQTLQALVESLPESVGSPAPRILDVGCGTGLAMSPLLARFPTARLIGVDFSEPMLRAAPHNFQKTCGDAARLPFADGMADLVFSNMTWQWCALPEALSEARRVLRGDGVLAFSTLVQGTFRELATAFGGIDAHPHTLAMLQEGEVLEDLVLAGFRSAVQRRVTRIAYFDDLAAALRSIRATGASEVGDGRRPGLLGRSAWRAVEARYRDLAAADGRLPLSYEVLEIVAGR